MAEDEFVGVRISVGGTYRTQILWAMANYNSVADPIVMTELPVGEDPEVQVLTTTSAVQALAWTRCQGPPGAAGMTYGGSDAAHTRWCSPQLVYYNLTYAASHFPTDNNKRYIACHELGHTIGLRHTNESSGTCMLRATITPKYVPTNTTTSGHDRSNIAFMY